MGWDELSLQLQSESDDSHVSRDDNLERTENKANDSKTDSLIKKYLMEGYVMMPSVCPECKSPLIKSLKRTPDKYEEYYEAGGFLNLEIKTARRIKMVRKGDMIGCVPYCLSCKVVVVTSNDELMVMWEDKHKHLMAEKGAVFLDMQKDETYASESEEFSSNVHISSQERSGIKAANMKRVEEVDSKIVGKDACEKKTRNGVVLLSRKNESDILNDESRNMSPTRLEEIDALELERQKIDCNQDETKEIHVSSHDPDDNSVSSAEEEIDLEIMPYEKRRQIATKVLGSKMVQGYTLLESQCSKCNMPMMEKAGQANLACVVCPVLKIKIQKKLMEKGHKGIISTQNVTKLHDGMENDITLKEKIIKHYDHSPTLPSKDQLELNNAGSKLDSSGEIESRDMRLYSEMYSTSNRQTRDIFTAGTNHYGEKQKYKPELYHHDDKHKLTAGSNNYDDKREHLIEELRRLDEEKHDFEREQIMEELRRAKEEREADARKLKIARMREIEDRAERDRLVEELRIAKAERVRDEMRRKEEIYRVEQEKKETEQLMKAKMEEYEKMLDSLKNAQTSLKAEATKREEELKMAEERARNADEKLSDWKATAEREAEEARECLDEAQQQLLDAEQARIEAEELALEAQKARELGYGDHSRLLAMYKKAQQLKSAAERDEQEAKMKFIDAKRKLDGCEKVLSTTEKKLMESKRLAEKDLEMAKKEAKISAQNSRMQLKNAEDKLLESRFGTDVSVSAAGNDWEARRLLGKKALANKAIDGWSVLPQYCSGRMCNFTPLISKNGVIQCVVCQGSGTGRDGVYSSMGSGAILDDTMSFVAKRNRFQQISQSQRAAKHDVGASREIGRRLLSGWQLSDTPCPMCMKPLMCESYGSHEICIFCDPDGDVELEGNSFEDLDDVSVCSRRSITLELPEGFDPSDSNAMAILVAKATKSASNSIRGNQHISRNKLPSQKRISGNKAPRLPVPASPRQISSRSPTPEKRSSDSSRRSRSHSRHRSRSRSHSANPSSPKYISTEGYDEDDAASCLSDDVSIAQSVASTTLKAILSKIENCKSKLKSTDSDDEMSVAERSKANDLIKKLASAAIAVKKLEAGTE